MSLTLEMLTVGMPREEVLALDQPRAAGLSKKNPFYLFGNFLEVYFKDDKVCFAWNDPDKGGNGKRIG